MSYQILTQNVDRFRRWGSLKAYFILDCIEVIFWKAAIVLTVMNMIKSCIGLRCILSGVGIGLDAILE